MLACLCWKQRVKKLETASQKRTRSLWQMHSQWSMTACRANMSGYIIAEICHTLQWCHIWEPITSYNPAHLNITFFKIEHQIHLQNDSNILLGLGWVLVILVSFTFLKRYHDNNKHCHKAPLTSLLLTLSGCI